jgi:RNA polymerase sigma-70 factor (ECF subfamily)
MGVVASPYAGHSDAELLGATPSDPEAFAALYDRYEDPLLAFFLRATRSAELAADLTAEVFAAALGSLHRFAPELGSGRAWLYGIARHELARAWERGRVEDRGRRRLRMERLVLTDDAIDRIDALAHDPAVTAALELLDDLPDAQATAVRAHVVDERDYADLARELGCSELVVRQRVSRALKTLRNRLEAAS